MSEVQGLQEFNAKVDVLLQHGNLGPEAYLEIGNIFLGEMQENFRVGGRPSPWKTSGRVEKFGGETLRLTGPLMRSLTVNIEERGFSIGSNLVYARIHALGGIIRAKNAPYLVFRVPSGLQTKSKSGKPLKAPKKEYALVRVKQVEIPQRDYRYISPRGFSFAASAALRHLVVA